MSQSIAIIWCLAGFAGMGAGLVLIRIVVDLLVGNNELDSDDRAM